MILSSTVHQIQKKVIINDQVLDIIFKELKAYEMLDNSLKKLPMATFKRLVYLSNSDICDALVFHAVEHNSDELLKCIESMCSDVHTLDALVDSIARMKCFSDQYCNNNSVQRIISEKFDCFINEYSLHRLRTFIENYESITRNHQFVDYYINCYVKLLLTNDLITLINKKRSCPEVLDVISRSDNRLDTQAKRILNIMVEGLKDNE